MTEDDREPSEKPSRPTPVRQAMEAERVEPEPVEVPSTTVEVDDEAWIVRVEGRATAGFRGDDGAPLLFLTFAREEDPETRLRETLRVGRRLEDLTYDDLVECLAEAEPYRSDWERSSLFPGTRKDRKRR